MHSLSHFSFHHSRQQSRDDDNEEEEIERDFVLAIDYFGAFHIEQTVPTT
jgi:hypothetical protein